MANSFNKQLVIASDNYAMECYCFLLPDYKIKIKSAIWIKVALSLAYWKVDILGASDTTQLTFTCSKSTIETLWKGVKYVQNHL